MSKSHSIIKIFWSYNTGYNVEKTCITQHGLGYAAKTNTPKISVAVSKQLFFLSLTIYVHYSQHAALSILVPSGAVIVSELQVATAKDRADSGAIKCLARK